MSPILQQLPVDRTVAQAVSCRPLTGDSRVLGRVSPYGIYREQVAPERVSLRAFPANSIQPWLRTRIQCADEQ
jgi:hypothetical protein